MKAMRNTRLGQFQPISILPLNDQSEFDKESKNHFDDFHLDEDLSSINQESLEYNRARSVLIEALDDEGPARRLGSKSPNNRKQQQELPPLKLKSRAPDKRNA